MELENLRASRPLVQAIDVLRDEPADPPAFLEASERVVRGVRRGAGDDRPTEHAARPVTTPRRGLREELLQVTGGERFQWPSRSR